MGEGILFNRAGVEFSTPIPDWATATDAEIVEAVERDRAGEIDLRDYWSVGDTRTVNLSAMSASYVGESHAAQSVELVLMDSVCTGFTWASTPASGITVPRFIVGMKDCLNEAGYMNSSSSNSGGWRDCKRRSWCNNVFSQSIPSTLFGIFKEFSWKQGQGGGNLTGLYTTTDFFALPLEKVIFGLATNSQIDEASEYGHWGWYQTAANRLKTVNGSVEAWWESSPCADNTKRFCRFESDGSAGTGTANYTRGISPFGCI